MDSQQSQGSSPEGTAPESRTDGDVPSLAPQIDEDSIQTATWGKSDYLNPGSRRWLPLITHLTDAADIAGFLWDTYLPEQVKRAIRSAGGMSDDQARRVYTFMAGAHDVGKASPDFVWKSEWLHTRFQNIIPIDARKPSKPVRHETISHVAFNAWALDVLSSMGGAVSDGPDRSTVYLRLSGWGVVVGGHHGQLPYGSKLLTSERLTHKAYTCSFDPDTWDDIRFVLLDTVMDHTGLTEDDIAHMSSTPLKPQGQVLLSAAVIMADWLASSETLCPLGDENPPQMPDGNRALAAMATLSLTDRWAPTSDMETNFSATFARRFDISGAGFSPRPVQEKTAEHIAAYAPEDGGMFMIIEDATGSGKTEAGLAAVEMLAARSGARGVMVALPTMATSNAMFERVKRWMRRQGDNAVFSTQLMHGQAALNNSRRAMRRTGLGVDVRPDAICCSDHVEEERREAEAVIHSWFNGDNRSILADFTVGTIDQVLSASMKRTYTVLPHLGLASKVILIDEVHDHDVRMRQFLRRILRWLGAYRVPVVALSATLTPRLRAELHAAYMGSDNGYETDYRHERPEHLISDALSAAWNNTAYPLISSSTPGGKVEVTTGISHVPALRKTVTVEMVPSDDPESVESVVEVVQERAGDRGCVAVVCNTVARAQKVYEAVRAAMSGWEVELLHSRFSIHDRLGRETKLVHRLGPSAGADRPRRYILVTTQVAEQSLDVDFDIMVTDICPMSALIQRAGRLHRHQRRAEERSEEHQTPRLVVVGYGEDDVGVFRTYSGTEHVYGLCAPMVSASLLMRLRGGTFTTPADAPKLVIDPFSSKAEYIVPETWRDAYLSAKRKEVSDLEKVALTARKWLVPRPVQEGNGPLEGWEPLSKDDNKDITVRSGVMDRKAYVVYRNANGGLEVRYTAGNGRVYTIPLEGMRTPLNNKKLLTVARQAVKLPISLYGVGLPNLRMLSDKFGHAFRWDLMDKRWLVDPERPRVLILEDDGSAVFTSHSGDEYIVRYSREHGLRADRLTTL